MTTLKSRLVFGKYIQYTVYFEPDTGAYMQAEEPFPKDVKEPPDCVLIYIFLKNNIGNWLQRKQVLRKCTILGGKTHLTSTEINFSDHLR